MRRKRLAHPGMALLLCAAALTLLASGCSSWTRGRGETAQTSQLASGGADASWSVSATGSAATTSEPAGGDSEPSAGSSKPAGKTLSDDDAKAIDAELSAIEAELDRMSLPNDSDFGGIESGLK